jgi:hypothetical protein
LRYRPGDTTFQRQRARADCGDRLGASWGELGSFDYLNESSVFSF